MNYDMRGRTICYVALLLATLACNTGSVHDKLSELGDFALDTFFTESLFAPGVNQEAILQLEIGMERNDLVALLGEPLSVEHRENPEDEIWVYAESAAGKEGGFQDSVEFVVVVAGGLVTRFYLSAWDLAIARMGEAGQLEVINQPSFQRLIPDKAQ